MLQNGEIAHPVAFLVADGTYRVMMLNYYPEIQLLDVWLYILNLVI
jgi:hypothetical protein